MAITRAQQVKQMLREGGRIGLKIGGSDNEPNLGDTDTFNPETGREGTSGADRRDQNKVKRDKRQESSIDYNPQDYGFVVSEPPSPFEGPGFDDDQDQDVDEKIRRSILVNKQSKPKKTGIKQIDVPAAFINKFLPQKINREFFYDNVAGNYNYGYDEKSYKKYIEDRTLGKIGAYGNPQMGQNAIDARGGGDDNEVIFPLQENVVTDPTDPNQTTDVFSGIAPAFAGSIFDFDKLRREQEEEQFAADGGRIGADEGGIMQMASAPDPMDTRNDMMQNLAIDNFGKPLKDLTEDEIIQIEEMMDEMDQYGSKPTSRSNKMMADLDIDSMIDEAKEQLSESRFGKSYDELNPLEQELILEIIRGVGKDVFGKRQMPESDRVMAQEGGIMDLETGRQMYFLGKLVKKATRAVKKIVKSPIGKAALMFGIPGTGIGGLFGRASFGTAAKGLFGKYGIAQTLGMQGISPGTLGGKTPGLRALLKRAIGSAKDNPIITSALTFGGLSLFGDEKNKQANLDEGPELTMEELEAIRNDPFGTTAESIGGSKFDFAADGGRIGYQEGSKEPVAKKTMPLLDMGGKEMDLRDDGGFVPIGRMEKADDVPARLSKNEFVFTADAVRNAGEGDVDKGAEVMYNMMKNLESGGEVSEESQGLEGARDMFQTSKRLEEVL